MSSNNKALLRSSGASGAGRASSRAAGRILATAAVTFVIHAGPAPAQSCTTVVPGNSVAPPTNVRQVVYSPAYSRLVSRNSGSAIAVIDTSTGAASLRASVTGFTDISMSPSGRYVFATDYAGENIGYGTPAGQHLVHRVDLSTGAWETRGVYIAGNIQAVSDDQFVLKSVDQFVSFTNNSWGTGTDAVMLNSGGPYHPFVVAGDFRYHHPTGRLLHGSTGSSSSEISAFKLQANNFVEQESSGIYGSAQGYGPEVAMATDGSAFYYGRLQVDPLDVSYNRRVFAEPIRAATGAVAFGSGGNLFDATNGDHLVRLGYATTAYALNASGTDFWAFDSGAGLLRHHDFGTAPCATPFAPLAVSASVPTGTKDIVVDWTGIAGATSYNLYLARQAGISKSNYLQLPGGVKRTGIARPFTEGNLASGNYYLVVTAVNTAGESVESAEVQVVVPDTMPPSMPGALAATGIPGFPSVQLNWGPATDNVGVAYYQVFRDGSLIANVNDVPPGFLDAYVQPHTAYRYRVSACDSANNCSALSDEVVITTLERTYPDYIFISTQYFQPRSTWISSGAVLIQGITGPAPITVSGGEYSINGAPFTGQPGTVLNNQSVVVRVMASSAYATLARATLNVGGRMADFDVFTVPKPVDIAPLLPLAPGNTWLMRRNGVDGIRVVADQVMINGDVATGLTDGFEGPVAYYSAGAELFLHRYVFPPAPVAGCGTVAEVQTFTAAIPFVSPVAGSTRARAGTMQAEPGACASLAYNYFSESTVEAFERVSVPAGQFDTTRVRVALYLSGAANSTTNLTYWFADGVGIVREIDRQGSVRAMVNTTVVRTVPDDFSFPAQAGVAINSLASSAPITVSGTTAPSPIAVTGGEYSIDGGPFTQAGGTVLNGQQVVVRVRTSLQGQTDTTAMLDIGGKLASFTARTGTSPLLAVESKRSHAGIDHMLALRYWLPLEGDIVIEPRLPEAAGHRIVFRFGVPVTQPGTASAVDAQGNGIGAVAAAVNPARNTEVIVVLSGVPDGRRVLVGLNGVNGNIDVAAAVGFLGGDVNGTGSVSAGDIAGVKRQQGLPLSVDNARFDLNIDGVIDQADVAIVKARSGSRLP